MNHRVTGEIETRLATAVEKRDLRRIANAEQDALQRHGIVDVQGADLRFGDRGRQLVVGHDRSSFRLRHAG